MLGANESVARPTPSGKPRHGLVASIALTDTVTSEAKIPMTPIHRTDASRGGLLLCSLNRRRTPRYVDPHRKTGKPVAISIPMMRAMFGASTIFRPFKIEHEMP